MLACQHCHHLNTSPCCTSLPCSENVITDRRGTNGKEHDRNAKKLTASRAFSPLLILCTSFSSSAKLVTEINKKNCYGSLLCQFSCGAILYNSGGKCCVLISISINFTSNRFQICDIIELNYNQNQLLPIYLTEYFLTICQLFHFNTLNHMQLGRQVYTTQ